MGWLLQPLGQRLAGCLARPRAIELHPATSPGELVGAALAPGDVLLVEGTSRLSAAINISRRRPGPTPRSTSAT